MKTLSIFCIMVVLIGCSKNNEPDINEILAQNNHNYIISLEEYQLGLKVTGEDRPREFDQNFYNNFSEILANIKNLKSNNDYSTLFKRIDKLSSENIIKEKITPIDSDNIEIQKNNLFLNLNKIVHQKNTSRYLIKGTNCIIAPLFTISKVHLNDTLIVAIYSRFNSFRIEVDSIEKPSASPYIIEKDYKIATIKSKVKNKNSNIKGKIFYTDEYSNYIFMEEFDTKNATASKFPY